MEAIAILLVILFSIIILKACVHLGIFMITLPFKIFAVLISILLVVLIMVPLGIVGGIAAIIAVPFAIIMPLLPILLILWGVYLLGRMSK